MALPVHDEHIDDWLYSRGWRQVSTQDECESRGCRCGLTGACLQRIFNHYMVEDGSRGSSVQMDAANSSDEANAGSGEASPLSFPICVNPDTVEMVGVEEVRCRRHTVGISYKYYEANVLKDHRTTTMVSAAVDGYKSACFNMLCYLLEVPKSKTPTGALAVSSQDPEGCWVLARSSSLTTVFLESLCTIDISPIVQAEDEIELRLQGCVPGSRGVLFDTSGFAWRAGGPNMIYDPSASPVVTECYPNPGMVRAVRTALVTTSILLTPKSLYGGKNPTTKLLTYFVHNICYSNGVQYVQGSSHRASGEDSCLVHVRGR